MKGEKKSQKSKDQSKLSKTIESLEKIDDEERSVQEDLSLALAYLESAKGQWTEKEKINRALSILLGVRNQVEAKIGEGFFDLDQWSIALPFLKRARDNTEDLTDEADEHLDELVEDCEARLTYPRFKECFKDRVKAAWKDFTKHATGFKKELSGQEPDEKGVQEIKINEIFDNALTYETNAWISKDGQTLKINPYPSDSIMRCFEWQYIKEQAPATVLKNWKFEIGDPPSTDPYLGVELEGDSDKPEKPDFDIKKISLWISGGDDEPFSVSAYCKDWEPFLEHAMFVDEEDVATTAVQEFLGSIVYDKYIDAVAVVDEPLPGKPIKVTDLPKYFADKGIDIHASEDSILNSTVTYKKEPGQETGERNLREDITSGTTMCKKLVDEYLLDESDSVDRLELDGASAGFLYYSIDSFKGRNAKKNREQFREALKKELLEKAGTDSVKIIGEATGTRYDYIDVLAWDVEQVMGVAADYFADSPIVESGYHVFRKLSGPVILTGEEDEEMPDPDEEDIEE